MSPPRPAEVLSRKRLVLRGGFLLIIGAFVLSNVFSLFQMGAVGRRNHVIVANLLSSIELVSRIARDIDQKRLLVDAHIFESTRQDMKAVEAKMANVDADFASTAAAYAPLANQPGEHAAWKALEANVSAIQQPIQRVLELSRKNEDAEARAGMVLLDGRFDDIDRTADLLVRINRDQADTALANLRKLRVRTSAIVVAIALGGTVVALFVSAWVARTLRRRDEEVRDAALLLEQQNRELDAFAGRVAHDLRGPLTKISLSASQLAKHVPERKETFSILQRGIERMASVIKDLLTLSHITTAESARCQPADVAGAVEEDLRPTVESAGGILHVDVAPATVRCQDGLLRQALWNLGENAVKYRRHDVRLEVTISGRPSDGSYELRVSDNGAGMSPDEARSAFEPFFRGADVRSSVPGTGLGLSIVKRIVEVSGGSVAIDSKPARGTSFIVRIPLA
jgi:two-component system OmpR family sensor kinase